MIIELNKDTLMRMGGMINEKMGKCHDDELAKFFDDFIPGNSLRCIPISDGPFRVSDQHSQRRQKYIDERLQEINATPAMEQCILKFFAPENFKGHFKELETELVPEFNRYLAFDKLKLDTNDCEAFIRKKIPADEGSPAAPEARPADRPWNREVVDIDFLELEKPIAGIIKSRLEEIRAGSPQMPQALIWLMGSALEGILLGVAEKHPQAFQNARKASGKGGETGNFGKRSLDDFIKTVRQSKLLPEDIAELGRSLKCFRNCIHPYRQRKEKFELSEGIARICFEVLKETLSQLRKNIHSLEHPGDRAV